MRKVMFWSPCIYLFIYFYLRIENAEGYVLIAVYLFIYFYLRIENAEGYVLIGVYFFFFFNVFIYLFVCVLLA